MKKRKRREGEVVCRCGAYRFPHRQMGGYCDGGAFVYDTFEQQMYGACRHCHFLSQNDEGHLYCEVLEGREPAQRCPELQEHIRYNEIRLYGMRKD